MNRILVTLVGGLCLCSLVSCASTGKIGSTADSPNKVRVTVEPEPKRLPFDPEGARLSAANRRLAELVGHAVELHIDRALVGVDADEFEQKLLRSFEGLIGCLEDARKDHAELFSYIGAHLERIDLKYDVLVESPTATLTGSHLEVSLPARPESLLPTTALGRAFERGLEDEKVARFSGITATNVPLARADEYFAFVSEKNRFNSSLFERRRREALGQSSAESATKVHLQAISEVLTLAGRLPKAPSSLRRRIHDWLLAEAPWFSQKYKTGGRFGDTRAGVETARAYDAWLASELDTLTANERLSLYEAPFPKRTNIAFPGIDRLGLSLAVVDTWLARGRPGESQATPEEKLMDRFVCPSKRNLDGTRSRRNGCQPSWFETAILTPELRGRLIKALERRDGELVTHLVAAYGHEAGLLTELDAQSPAWRGALVAVAEVLIRSDRGELEELLSTMWRTTPTRRGSLLYALTMAHARETIARNQFFSTFVERYGTIDAKSFTEYLSYGSLAFRYTPSIWPTLERRGLRIAPIVERFDELLSEEGTPESGSALTVLVSLVRTLCRDDAKDDIAALHAVIERRFATHPKDKGSLGTLRDDTLPGHCPKEPPRSSPF